MPERPERGRRRGNAAGGVVLPMQHQFSLEVGRKFYVLTSATIPPVESIVTVHKHLTEDGSTLRVKIIDHEWRLEEADGKDIDDRKPRLMLTLRTREV